MHDDLESVLSYIDSPELWKYFHAQSKNKTTKEVETDESTSFGARQKQLELGGNLQTAYHYQPGQWSAVQKAVYEEFKQDFDALGYDPAFVPS